MLRKEEARNRRSQAWPVVISTQRVPMTRGALLRSRVKGNFQARFWSSGGRGDSPTDCRKLSVPHYRYGLIQRRVTHSAPQTGPSNPPIYTRTSTMVLDMPEKTSFQERLCP